METIIGQTATVVATSTHIKQETTTLTETTIDQTTTRFIAGLIF